MDFSKVVNLIIPEGPVTKIQDKDGVILWGNQNLVAYGVRWNSTTSDTTSCERIGNLNYHRLLPIQSKLRDCVHQGNTIMYYTDPSDARFREDTTGFVLQNKSIVKLASPVAAGPDGSAEYTITDDVFSTNQYLWMWLKVGDAIVRVQKIDTGTSTAYFHSDTEIDTAVTYSVELGSILNGYDGEFGVDGFGGFYLWSENNEDGSKEVWISKIRCKGYSEYIPEQIFGAVRSTIVRTKTTGFGWLDSCDANTAVTVINYSTNLRGGNNYNIYDKYTGIDNWRSLLCKPATQMSLGSFRPMARKKGHECMPYQTWKALIWLYVIEYANFNVQLNYNSALTSDGYKQGGLGAGISSNNQWNNYNGTNPLMPLDYNLSLGNNSGIKQRASVNFYVTSNAGLWNSFQYRSEVAKTITDANKVLNITAIKKLYTDTEVWCDWSNHGGTYRYKVEGLTGGQTIKFKNGNTLVLEISQNGEYLVNWGNNASSRYLKFGIIQESCNIKLTILNTDKVTYTLSQYSWNVPSYRGIHGFIYGDIWNYIEGAVQQYSSTEKVNITYITNNPENFSESSSSKEIQIKTPGLNEGWIKEFELGQTGNVIANSLGGSDTKYKADFTWHHTETNLRCLLSGGSASYGSRCGLAYLSCAPGVGHAYSALGFYLITYK